PTDNMVLGFSPRRGTLDSPGQATRPGSQWNHINKELWTRRTRKQPGHAALGGRGLKRILPSAPESGAVKPGRVLCGETPPSRFLSKTAAERFLQNNLP